MVSMAIDAHRKERGVKCDRNLLRKDLLIVRVENDELSLNQSFAVIG